MIKVRFRLLNGEVLEEKSVDHFPAAIGRDSSCDIVVSDGGISSRHAEIECDGYWLTVRDLGSRNGTFVGGEQINSTKLKLPCAVKLGNAVMMEVESAAGNSAVATRAALMPRAMKRPEEPHVPMPVMPEPVPAMRMVIDDAEIIEGWERYWHFLKKAHPRPILLGMLGLAAFYALLHYAVFRESFFFSLGSGAGAAFACAVFAAILACLLALPGILFRGSYDFKPLFIVGSGAMMLLTIQKAILRPAMLMEYFGFMAQLLSVPLFIVVCIPFAYVLLFTTFSHRHAKKLVVLSLFFALLGIAGEVRQVYTIDRQALMREALMGEFRSARGLAGSSTEVKGVTDDIRAFGRGVK